MKKAELIEAIGVAQAFESTPVPADAVAEADASRDRFSELRRTTPTQLPGDRITPSMVAGIAALVAAIALVLRRSRRRRRDND